MHIKSERDSAMRLLFTLSVISLTLFFFMSGCSTASEAEKLYEQGKYKAAIEKLTYSLNQGKGGKAEAELLTKCQNALELHEADSLIKAGGEKEAIKIIYAVLISDSSNKKAAELMSAASGVIAAKVESKLIPAGKFEEAVENLDFVMKYNRSDSALYILFAEAMEKKNKGRLVYEVVAAWKDAYEYNPECGKCEKKVNLIEEKSIPYRQAFKTYISTVIKKDYNSWLRMLHPSYPRSVNNDLKRLREMDYDEKDIPYHNMKEYFYDFVAKMPEDMNVKEKEMSPPEIKIIGFPNPNTAVVYYVYSKQKAVCESQKIIRAGSSFRFFREEKSDVPADI